MLSIGVAISFDYCLFLCTRFREEIVQFKKSLFPSVLLTMQYAGHVIVSSGSCLSITFITLAFLGDASLVSIGVAAFVTLWMCIIASVTLFPALVFTFNNFFTNFELIPNYLRCLCCKKNVDINDDDEYKAMIPDLNDDVQIVVVSNWRKIASWVITKTGTITVFILVLVVTIPIGYQALYMNSTFDTNLVFIQGSPSLVGFQAVMKEFLPGQMDPYYVLITSNEPSMASLIFEF